MLDTRSERPTRAEELTTPLDDLNLFHDDGGGLRSSLSWSSGERGGALGPDWLCTL